MLNAHGMFYYLQCIASGLFYCSHYTVQHSLTPLTTDYLHKRKKDLKVEVFHGSIADRDQMMLGIDVVTAIEV